MLPQSEGRAGVYRHLRCASQLLCWRHGSSDADAYTYRLRGGCNGTQPDPGYLLVAEKPAEPSEAQTNGPRANGSANVGEKLASALPETLRSTKSPLIGIYSYMSKTLITGAITCYLLLFVLHCTWVTSNAYSSPSVVLASRLPDGSQHIIDDYREAYYWLRQNTHSHGKGHELVGLRVSNRWYG